jgi:hypothetical protein
MYKIFGDFMNKILLAVIFVTASLNLEANAQVIYIPQLDPVAIHLQQQLFQQMAFGEMYKNSTAAGSKVRSRNSNSQNTAAETAKSVTAFSPASGRILPARLSGATGKSATEISNARQIFDMFLSNYEKTAFNDGFPPNDLAYGFSFFIVNNYIIYHDLQEKSPADKALMSPSGDPLLAMQHSYSKKAGAVTSTAEKAVYQQVKTFLSANPAITKLTDRQKQEFTEMLAIVTVTNYYTYEMAGKNKNAEVYAKAQSAAKQSLEKLLGAPADKIKITAQGLEYK